MFHRAASFAAAPITELDAAIALFAPFLAGAAVERLCVAHLGADLRLLHLTLCPPGEAAQVAVPLRTVLHDALAADARGLILAHNHPGGDPTPSAADRRATRRVAEVARALNIRVIDHLVFAGAAVTSFRALALL